MTANSQINAGARWTASEARSTAPLAAYRSSDGTAMTSNTLANEPVLFLNLGANTTWVFELKVRYKGNTTGSGDLKLAWSVPSGCTISGSCEIVSNPLGVSLQDMNESSTIVSYSNGTSNPLPARLWGTVFMSGTQGNLQLQAAENTTNATGTTILKGSSFLAWQVG